MDEPGRSRPAPGRSRSPRPAGSRAGNFAAGSHGPGDVGGRQAETASRNGAEPAPPAVSPAGGLRRPARREHRPGPDRREYFRACRAWPIILTEKAPGKNTSRRVFLQAPRRRFRCRKQKTRPGVRLPRRARPMSRSRYRLNGLIMPSRSSTEAVARHSTVSAPP